MKGQNTNFKILYLSEFIRSFIVTFVVLS